MGCMMSRHNAYTRLTGGTGFGPRAHVLYASYSLVFLAGGGTWFYA